MKVFEAFKTAVNKVILLTSFLRFKDMLTRSLNRESNSPSKGFSFSKSEILAAKLP